MIRTPVCIVGAGPAGASLSYFLEKHKIDHILLDKAQFPRDKICGDGLTVDVLNALKRIDPELLQKFAGQSEILPCWGFGFHAANGREVRHDFKNDGFAIAPFYTANRISLDNFLVANLPASHGRFLPQTRVTDIKRQTKGMLIKIQGAVTGEEEIHCRFIIGAEGEKPVVTRYLELPHYREKGKLMAGLRIYHEGVQGFHENNHLEFFFDRSLLPGYFWAFPMAANRANSGVGMLSTRVSKEKINLKKRMARLITEHPQVRSMFSRAEALEPPRGWGLPLISSDRVIGGEGYALVGDAAGMIEPFTGKGIGPGMVSARLCAEHIAAKLKNGSTDLSDYGRHVYRYYKNEMKTGYRLQKSLRYPWAMNSFIGLANLAVIKNWAHGKMVRSWRHWLH